MRITRTLAGVLTVALAAPLSYADRERSGGSAQHRSGSESGSRGSSASAGERHHSGSSDSAQPRGGGSVSSSTEAAASRHPRAGSGRGHRGGYSHGGYYNRGGYYYSPYYWGFYPYGYSWYGDWGWGPYSWSRPYYRTGYYSGSGYRSGGALRVLVKPSQARVYVDGYYAGVADDFDGLLQRLNVPVGRHEIMFKLDGYRTHKMQVYVAWDSTLKLRHEMARGEGESVEDLVPPDADRRDRSRWVERDDRDRVRDRRRMDRDADRDAERGERAPAPDRSAALVLDVEPADASVYVDGEFRGSVDELRRIELAPGKHRLEIVRPGYVTLERDLDVGEDDLPLVARLDKK